MQQFTVPQFIDVESKIIGPITTRQFLIFLGAATLIGISYKLFDFALFLTVAIILALIAFVFAFIKINGRPFHFFVLNLIQTFRRPNLRVWNHRQGDEVSMPQATIAKTETRVSSKTVYRSSHLADLALIVDTKGRYRGDGEDN